MHTIQGLINQLEGKKLEHGEVAPSLDGFSFDDFRRFLEVQRLITVAQAVEGLEIRDLWFDEMEMAEIPSKLVDSPHAVVAKMANLKSLDLGEPWDAAILEHLPGLVGLTSLQVKRLSASNLEVLCNTVTLLHLEVRNIDAAGGEGDLDNEQILTSLVQGKSSGLQTLALPLPAADVQVLLMLTALTALSTLGLKLACELESPPPNLGVLANLSGLRSLRIGVLFDAGSELLVDSLTPVLALTGLTLLELREDVGEDKVPVTCSLPADVSPLSMLTALRVLRCSPVKAAEYVEGDPIPLQLRFMRTASSLEELDLGYWGTFWPLPEASRLAVRSAICSLQSLKKVTISVVAGVLAQYYAPLLAFAAAPSTETFSFLITVENHEGWRADHWPHDTAAQVQSCFRALRNLKSLSLEGHMNSCSVPHCADLLAGLPSTQLTRLNLAADTEDEPVMAQIARFTELQHVCMFSDIHNTEENFGERLGLKCMVANGWMRRHR